jgi:hypothetical protein
MWCLGQKNTNFSASPLNLCFLTREPRELPGFFGHETITNRLAISKNCLMQNLNG